MSQSSSSSQSGDVVFGNKGGASSPMLWIGLALAAVLGIWLFTRK